MKNTICYRLIEAKRRFLKMIYTYAISPCFQSIGTMPDIDPSFYFEQPDKIRIGNYVQIRRGVVILGRSDSPVGIQLGNNVHIKEYAYLDAYGGSIVLGEGVRIGHHAVIAGHGGVIFGNYSGVSGLSYVIAANHSFDDPCIPFVKQPETKRGIHIGNNVWGAANVVILDGVTIGDNAIIGAGSVVRKNIEAGAVVLGNPAKVAYFRDLP